MIFLQKKIWEGGEKYDFLLSGSIWNRPEDWMMGLLKDERKLAWFLSITESNSQKLEFVALQAKAFSEEGGRFKFDV